MSVLSDQDIIYRCEGPVPMISPFIAEQIKEVTSLQNPKLIPRSEDVRQVTTRKVISYGVSSYGYDMRVGYDFKVFTNLNSKIIDPKNFDDSCFTEVHAVPGVHEWVTIPPNSFALAGSIEEFHIPRDVVSIVLGKSTYARCGIIVNVTPLEPEWIGKVTIEISNTAPLPAVIYPGEGIAQVLFFSNAVGRSAMPDGGGYIPHVNVGRGYGTICKVSYGDKQGKYQHQTGITLPKV